MWEATHELLTAGVAALLWWATRYLVVHPSRTVSMAWVDTR